MTVINRFRALRRHSTEETVPAVTNTTEEPKQDSVADGTAPVTAPEQEQHDPSRPSEDLQHGVKNIEAVTLTWTKATLIAVFINIWFLYFVNAFQSAVFWTLVPYITSEFTAHSLLNVIYVVGDCMSAATYIPLARTMDTFGRAEGFLAMCIFATLGLIMMAACHNLPTFCAAYVFYNIGFSGMTYSIDVITADASKLKNRGLAFAFTSSPYIITAFAGPKVAEDFYGDISWRWGFGCFAIIFPIVAAPLFCMLKWNTHKAKKLGLLVREPSNRTFLQSIFHYNNELDLIGVILFSGGLVVFLLPFSIAPEAPNGWGSDYIIAMIVVGFVMLFVFILHEAYTAPRPMLNWKLLSDRTVIGACLLDATYQLCYYCWNGYFTSFLRVVNDITIAESGYVANTFDVVSGVLLLGVGFLIRRTGRFKWLLYIAVPLYIFAQGLMIYFRRPNQSVGYLVMCQVFISIGGAVFIICEQLAILAAVDHQHVATVLALLNVVGTVGDAAGSTICGVIWQATFKKALQNYLPQSAMDNFDLIYDDVETQVLYAPGSPTRLAIQKAYGYAQTRMLAAGTSIMVLAVPWTMMIRNIDLKAVQQVKGTVF
ncbi:hypothetical protein N7532_001559 [Penicillium argentinense]|uniref:Major facilitator superfamily (MFS) profile domain-containing protein n=1 Tax=Penicillium argentinense TaxID=1131581 RepID=A0A9W9G2P3_9EURO|nr:uncharacterized protein N7532_001559 [Penicillium argentinense]KAJ5111024.1 hypothetical protein N7532_001559 [Penicillium argentinense]